MWLMFLCRPDQVCFYKIAVAALILIYKIIHKGTVSRLKARGVLL